MSDTLSGTSIKKSLQENKSRKNNQEESSGTERLLPHFGATPFRCRQNPPILLGVVGSEGSKDVRQEDAAVIEPAGCNTPEPEPTPEFRRDKIAILNEALANMKRTAHGYKTLVEIRDEHLAALSTDTELRASA